MTGADGLPLAFSNFFTLDEAAEAALRIVLMQMEQESETDLDLKGHRLIGKYAHDVDGCDDPECLACNGLPDDALISYPDGTLREYAVGDLGVEQ